MISYDPNYMQLKSKRDRRPLYRVLSVSMGVLLLLGTIFLLVRNGDEITLEDTDTNSSAEIDFSTINHSDGNEPNIEARLDSCIGDFCKFLGVVEGNVRVRATKTESGLSGINQKKFFINVPGVYPMAHVNQVVHFAFRRRACVIIDAKEIIPGKKILILAGENDFVTHIITISLRADIQPEIGYISLLIGGIGKIDPDDLDGIFNLDDLFTGAIMPNAEYSRKAY